MTYDRYSLAETGDGTTWSVIDLFTGHPAFVRDIALDHLEIEEADALIELMNFADHQKRVLYAVRRELE